MKYLTLLILALSAGIARADTAIYDVTLDNANHQWTERLTSYVRTSTDIFTMRVNGGVLFVYNAGAHRGNLWSSDAIGRVINTGGGGGGDGGHNLHRPDTGVRFTMYFSDRSTGLVSSYTLNISFLSGGITFSGSYDLGYSVSSYSPSTATTTWSNSGVTDGRSLTWPYESREGLIR